MGDRGNIKLTGGPDFPTPVCIYTHWCGQDMKSILAEALQRGRSRWDDHSYLGRIIVQGFIGQDNGITGFGISSVLQDNEHPILVVNMENQTIYEEADMRKNFGYGLREDSIREPISFEDFIAKQTK